jgi:hypothetical protein
LSEKEKYLFHLLVIRDKIGKKFMTTLKMKRYKKLSNFTTKWKRPNKKEIFPKGQKSVTELHHPKGKTLNSMERCRKLTVIPESPLSFLD